MLLSDEHIKFKAVRSGGPGGQNVNRRATKIQARVKVADLPLSATEKARVRKRLAHRVIQDDEIIVESDTHRSQARNRKDALERLNSIIEEARRPRKRRIPTEPPPFIDKQRIEEKRWHGREKEHRTKDWQEETE